MAELDAEWIKQNVCDRDYEARLRLLSPFEFRLVYEATMTAERLEAQGGDMVKCALLVQRKANESDIFCAVFNDDSDPSGFGFAPLKGLDAYERICAGEEIAATVGGVYTDYRNLEMLDDLINSTEYNHYPFN